MNDDMKTIRFHLEEVLFQIESALGILGVSSLKNNRYHYFLIHSAIIYKILHPNLQGCTPDTIKLMEERRKLLEEYFGDKYEIYINKLKLLLKEGREGFRNHLEHVDERIDNAVKKGGIARDNNSEGISIHDFFGVPKECCLVNFENNNFTFLGETFNLDEVKSTILEIKEYINEKGLPENISGFSISNNVIC